MASISNCYWPILESLHFPVVGAPKDSTLLEEERIKTNLEILQQFIKLTPDEVVKTIIMDKQLNIKHQKIIENTDDYFVYCLYSLKMLLGIITTCKLSSDTKQDLIPERHKSLIISCIADVAKFGFEKNLNRFRTLENTLPSKWTGTKSNIFQLEFLVEIFYPFMLLKELRVGRSLDKAQMWYMASIFSLLIANNEKEIYLDHSDILNLNAKLGNLWLEHSKKSYFRNLMMMFACSKDKIIYKEMLSKLFSPNGFVALLFAMKESGHNEKSLEETVSNLVAQPSYSVRAQHSLIQQILQYLETFLNKNLSVPVSTVLLSLRKLYDNKPENKEFIKKWLAKQMEPLIKVEMSEMIAMDWLKFADFISLIYHLFCTSSIATLPSELLVPYLPLILELYSQLECHTNQTGVINHFNSIILKILNNRSKEDLKKIIECVIFKSYPDEWLQLSPNIQIRENPLNMQELKLSIIDSESGSKFALASLINILKNSSYNLLLYTHFSILLQLVPAVIIETNSVATSNTNIDLLTTEEDIYNKILKDFSLMYESKIQIIKGLEALVHHKPLKFLINDNIIDLLKVLQNILKACVETFCKDNCQAETNSEVLTILIILIREIVENSSTTVEDLQTNLLKPLKTLESQIDNENLKYQLNCLLKVIEGEESCSSKHFDTSRNDFEEARSLIESNESYLQVQGIEVMIKLVKKRDVCTVSNGHMLTALALNTLKSPESYTFLNCVRLFVALVNVNESEILQLLTDEYTNEAAPTDYRLIIGEAILKISIELGPLCYKYKSILLNTYMAGCRSPLDEFRFSAFANLSQMCRQLTYQVHNYFEELLNLIDCELRSGKYLPAKRAAVMVLSDLLAGMDNLFDYQEMLLPIYRLLKYLAASEENDEKIRLHASNGLMCLSEKCKELLNATIEQPQLEKEIKIMGIYEKTKNVSIKPTGTIL